MCLRDPREKNLKAWEGGLIAVKVDLISMVFGRLKEKAEESNAV